MKKFLFMITTAVGDLLSEAFEAKDVKEAAAACEAKYPESVVNAIGVDGRGIKISSINDLKENNEVDGDNNINKLSLIQTYPGNSSESLNWSYDVVGERALEAVKAREAEAGAARH